MANDAATQDYDHRGHNSKESSAYDMYLQSSLER